MDVITISIEDSIKDIYNEFLINLNIHPAHVGICIKDKVLIPAYEECIKYNRKMIIDLDGGFGYINTFLKFAFSWIFKKNINQRIISFKSDDEPSLLSRIQKICY